MADGARNLSSREEPVSTNGFAARPAQEHLGENSPGGEGQGCSAGGSGVQNRSCAQQLLRCLDASTTIPKGNETGSALQGLYTQASLRLSFPSEERLVRFPAFRGWAPATPSPVAGRQLLATGAWARAFLTRFVSRVIGNLRNTPEETRGPRNPRPRLEALSLACSDQSQTAASPLPWRNA